jgi:C4-type Zn-finger protein
MPRTKMICPVCGAEMNLHAEKLLEVSPADPAYNLSLGGALEESHACPSCGASASRLQLTSHS